jgi:hypothetical protein
MRTRRGASRPGRMPIVSRAPSTRRTCWPPSRGCCDGDPDDKGSDRRRLRDGSGGARQTASGRSRDRRGRRSVAQRRSAGNGEAAAAPHHRHGGLSARVRRLPPSTDSTAPDCAVMSTACRRPAASNSRCCRPTTPLATSPRSCSACRSRSYSTITNWPACSAPACRPSRPSTPSRLLSPNAKP